MVVTRLRTPPKRSSISQISKKITNTIYTLIQRSGVRRGLFFTNVREKNKANNSSTIEVLPLEILFNIFEFSSAEKLTKFCLSNQKMMMNVSKYVSSESFARRFSTTAISLGGDETQLVAHFTASGRLIRACLVFRGTQVLIKFVLHFYSKVYKRIEKEYGWTFLFSEALHNATQHEYVEFMRALFDLLGIFGLARRVVEAPIKIPDDELRLRRLLFVHFLDDCEAGSLNLRLRLSAVLRFLCPQKMEYKLLMILGAPIVRDDQDGSEFIDYDSPYIEVINEVEMVKAILGEISELTEELLATKDLQVEELRWSEMQIFNLMETITTYPEPWVLPNFASFLLCSPRLARLAIYTRAIYGSVTEAGYTLFSCVEMAVRLGRDPYLLLHLAAREVSARCTVDICMTMFRESIANAQQRCVDVFNAVTGASDREFVHETMEVTKQISSLIQNMLYLIFG